MKIEIGPGGMEEASELSTKIVEEDGFIRGTQEDVRGGVESIQEEGGPDIRAILQFVNFKIGSTKPKPAELVKEREDLDLLLGNVNIFLAQQLDEIEGLLLDGFFLSLFKRRQVRDFFLNFETELGEAIIRLKNGDYDYTAPGKIEWPQHNWHIKEIAEAEVGVIADPFEWLTMQKQRIDEIDAVIYDERVLLKKIKRDIYKYLDNLARLLKRECEFCQSKPFKKLNRQQMQDYVNDFKGRISLFQIISSLIENPNGFYPRVSLQLEKIS